MVCLNSYLRATSVVRKCFYKVLTDVTDSASSTVKPEIGSTHNSPTPSATSNLLDLSSSAAKTANETNPDSAAFSEPLGKPAEGVPNVPIRSSSNAKVSSLDTIPMPEKTVADPISVSRRGSKGSIKPKSRSGSIASSKYSKKEKAAPGVAATQEKPAEEHSAINTRQKKSRGFLSFLNCCTPPENATTVELGDQAVPAKKTKILQPKSGRQPTPVVKPNASAGESTTGESKEAKEEGIGGPEYSEKNPAAKSSAMTRSSKEKVTTEKVGPPGPLVEPVETVESPPPAAYRDPPLPPVPSSNIVSTSDTKDEQGIPTQAAGIAAPPQLIEPDQSVAEQGTTINDRTPQQEQRDSDIAMVDAPQIPSAEEPSNTSRELQQAQINLPPPPPRNGNGGASASNGVTPGEKQQWLLPPLQPQLKGRKCLVLDLDETLVHSSFKVRNLIF